MERTFDEIYDEIVEDLRGNLTNEEYRELITLEYVVTQGYDKKGDYERYKELSEKVIELEDKFDKKFSIVFNLLKQFIKEEKERVPIGYTLKNKNE